MGNKTRCLDYWCGRNGSSAGDQAESTAAPEAAGEARGLSAGQAARGGGRAQWLGGSGIAAMAG